MTKNDGVARFYVYGLYRDLETTIPFYIGKGTGDRLDVHEKSIESEKKYNIRKYNIAKKTIAKFGFLPRRKIFDSLHETHSFELEKFLISFFGRIDIKTGILSNVSDGGLGCSKSPEVVDKIKAARAKQVFSKESRDRQAAKMRLFKHKNEAKARISAAQRGRLRTEQQKLEHSLRMKGRRHTEETKLKMSDSRKGKKLSVEHAQAISLGQLGRVQTESTRLQMSLSKKGKPLSEAHKQAIRVGVMRKNARNQSKYAPSEIQQHR